MSKIYDVLHSSRQVRKAEVKDIPGVLSVLEQNLIANRKIQNHEILEQTGFLINSFSYDDAKSAITDEDNFIFVVSTENNDEIIGYAIGCDVNKLSPIFQKELSSISSEIKDIIPLEKILYLRHIAKKADKNYVGQGLFLQLLDYSKRENYKYIICVIAEKPIQNKASKKFHEKNGFFCAGFYQDGNKMSGVYLRKI